MTSHCLLFDEVTSHQVFVSTNVNIFDELTRACNYQIASQLCIPTVGFA